MFKKFAAAVAVAALAAVGAIAASPAMADTVEYKSWTESDDPKPMTTTHAMVFYKAASINFGHVNGAALEPLVPLADVDGLAYTVAESTSYAPSYQIDVVSKIKNVTYARLVWEPYMQSPTAGEKTGEYADLENGVWWGNRVFVDGKGTSPFGTGDGSQSKPQSLTWFKNYFGDDAQVAFFGLKQGSTTDSTSTVTSLTFEGEKVPLGTVDETPFSSKDVEAAVTKATAPLTAQVADLEAELKAYKETHPLTTEGAREGYVNTADAAKAKWKLADGASLVATQNDTATRKAKIVSISGTKKVGRTVTAWAESLSGSSRSYQWYVAGRSLTGATMPTLKLARSSAEHSLSVKITTSWIDELRVAHTVSATAKYLRTAYVAR